MSWMEIWIKKKRENENWLVLHGVNLNHLSIMFDLRVREVRSLCLAMPLILGGLL